MSFDEEIVPNPKVSFFKKGLLPDLGKVRKWFKRSNDQVCNSEAASSTVPCLLVTYKVNKQDMIIVTNPIGGVAFGGQQSIAHVVALNLPC
jgi:hypothetical protein